MLLRRLNSEKPRSLPVPSLEHVGDGMAEAGQEVFLIQKTVAADQAALGERMADLGKR